MRPTTITEIGGVTFKPPFVVDGDTIRDAWGAHVSEVDPNGIHYTDAQRAKIAADLCEVLNEAAARWAAGERAA